MRFETGQHLRLGQHMKLAPKMIQSMEILQLPLLVGGDDRLAARVRAARAALAAADARVGARALDVQFTEVRAPITGRISEPWVAPK